MHNDADGAAAPGTRGGLLDCASCRHNAGTKSQAFLALSVSRSATGLNQHARLFSSTCEGKTLGHVSDDGTTAGVIEVVKGRGRRSWFDSAYLIRGRDHGN